MSVFTEPQIGRIEPKEYYKILDDESGQGSDYTVMFRITDACDLQCSYCHWYGGPKYSFQDVCGSIDVLFEFFKKEKFKQVTFYYHGGEPTRHPQMLDILTYIREKQEQYDINVINEVQTNLTQKQSFLEAMLPLIDLLDVSFHYLELKRKGNKLPTFLDNYNWIRSINYPIHALDIMLENVPEEERPGFYAQIEELLTYENIFQSEMIYGFCHYRFNRQTAEQHLEFYKKHNKTERRYEIDGQTYNTNDLFAQGVNCRGWMCAAGQDSITINGDGNIFHCGIHMTNYARECVPDEKPWGNLLTDTSILAKLSILFRSGTKCRWLYCGGDFYLNRRPSKQ